METDDVKKLVGSLRELADFFENNGEDLPQFVFDPQVKLASYVTLKEDMVTGLKVMSRGTTFNNPVVKNQTDFAYELTRKFGEAGEFQIWTNRDTVCERVQTGVKTEPVREYVETGETKEVPVYEWHCNDSLLAAEPTE